MEPIIISHPSSFKEECSIVNQLFEAGLQIFHLRKPGFGRLDYRRFLAAINPLYYNRIALHQYHELADQFDLNRLHYPEALRSEQQHLLAASSKVSSTSKQLKTLPQRSTSIHDLDELRRLGAFDYTFFSPVFDSISKPGYRALTDQHFQLDKGTVPTKVVALGGIKPDNVFRVKEMKFDGIAVLGCIWNQPREAVATFLKIKTIW